jgi:hypothetical protein
VQPGGAGGGLSHIQNSRSASGASWQWLSSVPSLFDTHKLPCKVPEQLPRQSNDSDCGVFALQYAESFSLPLLPHVTSLHVGDVKRMRALFGADFFGASDVERKRQELRKLILNQIAKRDICRPPS